MTSVTAGQRTAQATPSATSNGNSHIETAIRQDLTPPLTPPSPSQATGEKFQTPHGVGVVPLLDTIKDEANGANLKAAVVAALESAAVSVPAATEDEIAFNEQKEIAQKLFKEEFVSIQPEEYTQFLAANDNDSTNIRECYMDLFEWSPNLLISTRMLCAKLYLKGESQEIDRILSSFTKSYIKQHPTNVFATRNFEKIYIILYSLILLNTALHNSELNKKSKISQADYIKNTFSTFIQQNTKSNKTLSIKQRITIERVLLAYYEDLSKNELQLKQSEPLPQGNLLSKQKKNNRMSIVESVLSRESSTPSSNPIVQPSFSIPQFSNADLSIDHRALPPLPSQSQNGHGHHNGGEDLSLSRQISGSSIWSTDTNGNRRQSLQMKRIGTTSSTVSQYTAINTSSLTIGSKQNSARVGFTRALLSDQNNQKFGNYDQRPGAGHSSPFTVRNRQSLSQLRNPSGSASMHSTTLNKRSSRASIISRESTTSTNGDDTLSVLSLDTFHMNDMNFGDEYNKPQLLDEFNVDDYQDQYDLTLELQGSPYLKEGLLRLKILNNDQLDNSTTNSQEISQPNVQQPQSAAGRFFSFFSKSAPPPPTPSLHVIAGTNTGLVLNRFVENFVVVSKGELQLYSFDPKVIKKHQQKLKKAHKNQQIVDVDDDEIMGDGNWLKNAANIGNYNLCATFAHIEKSPSSGSTAGKVLWSLNFPRISKKSPKKFIFEAGTSEVALEFINTCNFWASKITAIPTLEESISSIEYGWTNVNFLINNKDNFKKLKNIQRWEQLPQGTFLSNYIVNSTGEVSDSESNHLGMMKQFVHTLNYYNNLKKHFHEFQIIKGKFSNAFNKGSYGSNYKVIIANYELKNQQYKFELRKYKNYLIILGFGLQLRFDLEEQVKAEAQQIDDAEIEDGGSGSGSGSGTASINDVEDPIVVEAADPKEESKEAELTDMVKYEIGKLFMSMKDIGTIIPTFQSSRSLNNLNDVRNGTAENVDSQFLLVKSPKTFTLANYKDNELPVTNLIQSQTQSNDNFSGTTVQPLPIHANGNLCHIHGDGVVSNTIKEEEEPESDSELIADLPPAASPFSTVSINAAQKQTLNVAKAHIVHVNK